jgi:hypothetical protein
MVELLHLVVVNEHRHIPRQRRLHVQEMKFRRFLVAIGRFDDVLDRAQRRFRAVDTQQ